MKDTKKQIYINNLPDLSLISDSELNCLAEEFEKLITDFYKIKPKPKEPP